MTWHPKLVRSHGKSHPNELNFGYCIQYFLSKFYFLISHIARFTGWLTNYAFQCLINSNDTTGHYLYPQKILKNLKFFIFRRYKKRNSQLIFTCQIHSRNTKKKQEISSKLTIKIPTTFFFTYKAANCVGQFKRNN